MQTIRIGLTRSVCSLVLLLSAGRALAAPPQAAPTADPRPKLAVLDLGASGTSASLAAAVTGVVANEVDRLGSFKVITSDAIRAMLALEQQKQVLGCAADSACLAEIGGALGVDYLVSGRVTVLRNAAGATSFTLDLTLSNVKRSLREGSAVEIATSETDLVGRVPIAVSHLTSKVLATRGGKLVLTASEAGAVVKVDDQVKGTTPLEGALPIGGGLHLLLVEKQGFVTWQKDVQMAAGKLVEERATLAPSPDFVKEYEARNRKLRTFAWISRCRPPGRHLSCAATLRPTVV